MLCNVIIKSTYEYDLLIYQRIVLYLQHVLFLVEVGKKSLLWGKCVWVSSLIDFLFAQFPMW